MRTFQSCWSVWLTLVFAGCSGADGGDSGGAYEETGPDALGQVAEALVGQDTFLYFRCNATSWEPSNTTRLRPANAPYSFELLFDVKQEWMTGAGDSCVFTETNQRNGWGTKQTSYGTLHGNVRVPGGDALRFGGGNFNAIYPALGRYKVTANWRQGSFQIAPANNAERWSPCLNENVTSVARTPQAPKSVLVGCSNGDVFSSLDGSVLAPTWLKLDTWSTSAGTLTLPDLAVNAIAYSPSDIKTAYVAFAGARQGHKLWKTSTGGASWLELSSVPLAEIWSISVNPLDVSKVYVAGPSGVFMSPDAGATWTSNVTPGPLTVPLASGAKLSTVNVAPQNPNLVWVGATNGDIFGTDNASSGQTWFQVSRGMPSRSVLRITLDGSQSPPRVFATFDGLASDSVWITTNNGFGWANLHTPPLPTSPMPLPGIYALYGVSPNPIDPSVVYIAGTYGAGISTSGGAAWSWTSAND
jgi:hypothetical protein